MPGCTTSLAGAASTGAAGGGAAAAADGGVRVPVGRRRRAAGVARHPDAMVADRVFDLGQPGLGEQPGQRADHLGIGIERRAAPAKLHRDASPDSASITLASASSASS